MQQRSRTAGHQGTRAAEQQSTRAPDRYVKCKTQEKRNPQPHHARARPQVSRIPQGNQIFSRLFLLRSHLFGPFDPALAHSPLPAQPTAGLHPKAAARLKCRGKRQLPDLLCAYLAGATRLCPASCIFPPSSGVRYVLSRLRLSHSPAHCIAAARCESRKNHHHSNLHRIPAICHSFASALYSTIGKGPALLQARRLSPSHRPTKDQEDPSNYPQTHDHSKQHPSPRASAATIPFCHRRILFCPRNNKQTHEKILLDRALEQHGGQQPRIQTESRSSARIERQQPYQNDAYVEQ
jgi:hypothetical protein